MHYFMSHAEYARAYWMVHGVMILCFDARILGFAVSVRTKKREAARASERKKERERGEKEESEKEKEKEEER